MQLQQATWHEVEAYLTHSRGIIIPIGSTEQHGPMGLIGTDALCAQTIAHRAGDFAHILVAPTLAYTPAQFNLGFPGSISITSRTLMALFTDIVESIQHQGFTHIYVLNGHGANIAPLRSAIHDLYSSHGIASPRIRLKSWWDYPPVNSLRRAYYGEWEGMHATPSEIAITRVEHRHVDHPDATEPPTCITDDFIREHAGDQHAPAVLHKQQFPDGRVGSHSALATREQGEALVNAAAKALVTDYQTFVGASVTTTTA